MQEAVFSQFGDAGQPPLGIISALSPQDPGKGAPRNAHNPEDSREILPPGQLHREDSDSALTGITRSLQRRLLGLRDLARGRTNSPDKNKKLD